jgi:hypothetical protein
MSGLDNGSDTDSVNSTSGLNCNKKGFHVHCLGTRRKMSKDERNDKDYYLMLHCLKQLIKAKPKLKSIEIFWFLVGMEIRRTNHLRQILVTSDTSSKRRVNHPMKEKKKMGLRHSKRESGFLVNLD